MPREAAGPVEVTEAELADWGRRIGRLVQPPVFIGLSGPLGAGKSVLARAVAQGAGVRDQLPSPTFNLLFRYETGRGAVIHADLYRLRSEEELAGIGWDDVVGDEEAIVLVEWPKRAGTHLPEARWEVRLRYAGEGGELRAVDLKSFGDPPRLPGFLVRAG